MSRPGAVDPDAARRAARSILSQHDYRPERSPQPLTGALRWIGDRLHEIFDPVGRFFDRIFGPLFRIFPGATGKVVGLLILLAASVFVIWLMTRHRIRSAAAVRSAAATTSADRHDDPDELERAAAAAELAGDFSHAVRLRYRAGLLRLDARGAIHVRPGITNAAYARTLHSPRFDGLTDTFESVTYGTTIAERDHADEAAREWPRLVTEAQAP